ncbi:glycosyltransferase [Sphaerisporangium krabiense]|uniref:Glycosyltransferase involved in cell wall biosynthesis n=1 Tax=Sphaerisporangium krabiense TaxID=763782 RepID=A0A7W8Z5T2_9ACTN|nr:glycosyltransferase [Sphaerisporangium krabiense]MBB5628032.1 glycosyltransferase involved in cell wall biosynthesis [Sphaerisporangium krabiense]
MKVAMVSEHASPLAVPGSVDSGGQNIHVAALSRALAALGHEVAVYTRRDDPGLPETVELAPGVSVTHVPAGPPARISKDEILAYVPDLAHWLRRRWMFRPPDVVHSHFWMSGLAALAAARDPGVPVVHTFHALGVVKRRHQGAGDTSPSERLKAEAVVARGVARVVATCADEAAELAAMDVPGHAVAVVPCGVDCAGFAPAVPAAPRPRGPRLLSIGRLVPRKGVQTIIEALRLIPDAELIVAGGPPAAELDGDPEVARLRRAAGEAGVAGRVRFTGQVSHEKVPALMRSCDVAVCVPWYEPFGMVALEAMACGLPVVASDVGGHRETVADGRTGTLVPPRDPRALAAAVNTLLADPRLRAAYGRAGARRARARYAWPRIAAATAAVYEDVRGSVVAAGVPASGRKAS